MALSIDELRAFVVAVDLGSVGRAARALGVTQSALSKRIKSFEVAAGLPVLERTASGVRPSPAGLAVLDEARRLLAQADALEAKLAAQSKVQAPIRIAASPALAERVVPAAVATLEVGRAALPIELLVANSFEVLRAVDEGRVDIGVAAADLDADLGVNARLLGGDELVVAIPDGDPWSGFDAIGIDLLVTRRLVLRDPASHARQLLERAISAAGQVLEPPLLEVGNPAAVKAAVRASGAPGVLSKHAVEAHEAGLSIRPIAGLDVRRQFWVLLAPGAAPAAQGIADGLVARAIS